MTHTTSIEHYFYFFKWKGGFLSLKFAGGDYNPGIPSEPTEEARMIPNQWYVVLESNEVRAGKPVGVLRLGERLVLWRDAEGVHCLGDQCPHRGASLAQGKLVDARLQCPFHGFEFDPGGACCYVPANGRAGSVPKALRAKAHLVREAHGYIYLWWGEPQAEYPPLPWFDDLDDSFFTSSARDRWAVHYSRAIENQLDVFHLPFPHATTIGRGERVIADGPQVAWDGNEMRIWVYNRVEDGQPAIAARDLPAPDRPPFLQFQMPHLWMNRISDDFRITVFFVPVDEHNCILYLRYYQRFLKLPLVGQAVAALSNWFSVVIVNQDKRVVLRQQPDRSDWKMDEVLIPADRPIIEYRRRRHELQQAARPG
jgi:phenylpropionate dioxygenase-like ring-hydroxylating dioxygenase large terminal subunit